MSVTRRAFLYASTVIGSTGLLNPIIKASQMAEQSFGFPVPPRTVNIFHSSAAHAEFEAGVRSSLDAPSSGHVQSIAGFGETAFDDFDHVKRHLAQKEGTAVVGLMNDSESMFFTEAIRDLGGSILCHGSHVETGAFSRHEFVTTPASAGIGSVFGHRLAQGGQHALIQEVTLHTPVSPLIDPQMDSDLGDWSWRRLLGYHLGQIASGNWSAASVIPRLLIGTPSTASHSGQSCVSLVALM